MKTTTLRLAKQNAGVLVELAIVLPVILLLGLIALEFANLLRYYSMTQLATREGAARIYRECSALKFPGVDAQMCMDKQSKLIYNLTANLSPNCIVDLYVAENPNQTQTGKTRFVVSSRYGGSLSGSASVSRPTDSHHPYPVLTSTVLNGYDSGTGTFSNHPVVATAEVWIKYRAIVPGISKLFGMEDNWVYDATII